MTKAQLRKIYLQKRLDLTQAECLQLSRQLCEQFFFCIDVSLVKVLHIFLPIEKKNEPNTWLIIDRLRREFPNVRLSIPKTNGTMENFYFEGLHQLETNAWGIAEPKQGIPTPTEKIDVVLVPLVAFDSTGHRVGYGKGYYDRFLASCRTDCKKIGISFFEPVDLIDDTTDTDIKLNGFLTPSNFFSNF
jgi:5-formyltetrahydrofolate cyclo-ligase